MHLLLRAVVRQIVVSYLKRISFYLKEARKLFGFGLQNDSSTGERFLAEDVNRPRPGYEKNRLVFGGMALEATLPPHNDGVARRVLERIGSCFHAQSESL
jgi:hypothetical protein